MPKRKVVLKRLADVEPQLTSHRIGQKSVLLANDETESCVTQIAVTQLRAGEAVAGHVHPTMDEHYLFLEGKGVMQVEGEAIMCEKGLFLLVPAQSEHAIEACTDMKFITIGVAL